MNYKKKKKKSKDKKRLTEAFEGGTPHWTGGVVRAAHNGREAMTFSRCRSLLLRPSSMQRV